MNKKSWKWIIIVVLAAIIGGSFFLFTYKFGSGKKHPIGSNLGKFRDGISSFFQTEPEFIYLSIADRISGMEDGNKIGWISDVHADRFKRRDIPSGLMFPRQYSKYLPKVFDAMRQQGINTVIATGDNTNSGDNGYAQDLARMAHQKNMHIIWVKGNHDNDQVMSTLGIPGNKYYYIDQGNTRIVVLDDVESDGSYLGSIDQNQLDWLKTTLQTDRRVIVSMHIPIFIQENIDKIHDLQGGDFQGIGGLADRYIELENILHASGNVKMVISGHWHLPWHKLYDEIDYYGEAALTREGYSGAYATIDLKNNSVSYSFAK